MTDFKDKAIILPPRFLGSVSHYAAMTAYPMAVIDRDMPFNKREKATHRTVIADTRGLTSLTVPVEKPVSMTSARWSDIVISGHGKWWNVMYTTLQSAYGRTPYFEYYADDFRRFFTEECAGMKLTDYNRGLDALVRRLAGVTTQVYDSVSELPAGTVCDDFRRRPTEDITHDVEYYQVRSLQHGFLPGLSMADMLFNMGPESILVLRSMAGI